MSTSLLANTAPSLQTPAASEHSDGLGAILERLERQRAVRTSSYLKTDIQDLKRSFKVLQLNIRGGAGGAAASAIGEDIALSTAVTYATLTSTDEINTDTTSYTPTNPAWTGASTSNPTVGGFYNGDQGTDTLTFRVDRAGVQTVSNVRVDVYDSGGTRIDRINVQQNNPVDEVYTLSNGLTVEFDGGVFLIDDTFTVDVGVSANLTPDPDGAFNGAPGPGFENGVAVTAGSFTVNGEAINVAADDTINTVLGKINSSAAGVTATYDAAAETVELVQNTGGSAPDIALGADTSGFLAAVKLDAAVVVPGTDSDYTRPLGDVPAFSSVTAGSLLINGNALAIDPATDSFNDLLDGLTQTDPNVEVRLIQGSKLLLSSTGEFELDSNGTNLFEAFGIASDTYAAVAGTGRPQAPDSRIQQIVRDTDKLLGNLGDLLDQPAYAPQLAPLTDLRTRIDSILNNEFDAALDRAGVNSGLRFRDDGPSARAYAEIEGHGLKLGFKRQLNETIEVYLGKSSTRPGVLDQLLEALDDGIRELRQPGLFVDVRA